MTGRVVKGPVAGAAVEVFAIDADGRRTGAPVGKATTDDAGAFSAAVGGHAGAALVCARQGTYVEEATGGLVQLAGNELCALVDNHELGKETAGVLLTPFSSWHAALSSCFAGAGRDPNLDSASAHAALRLNDFLAAGQTGYDFRSTLPFDPTAGPAPSLTPEVWQGILLAAVSQSAKAYALASGFDPGVRVTAATLTTALVEDVDDGLCVFDGQSTTGVLSQGTVPLSVDALRGSPQGLGSGILRFLENTERNLSGVTSDDVTDLVVRINAHDSEIFGQGGQGGDVDAPIVTFVTPADAATVAGVIDVNVTATDASALQELVFTAPARLLATERVCDQDNLCTLAARLNTSLEEAGALVVSARAVDAAGNATTATVTLTINDDAPNIAISTPAPGKVSGELSITATASDTSGIQSLVLSGVAPEHLTLTSLRTDEVTGVWHTGLDAEGPVTLTFTATDVGGQSVAANITVEVDNLEDGVITGAIDVGTPLLGGSVSALALSAAGRGAVIATTAVDDETGSFSLTNPFYSGPLLLVVTGGAWVDPATGGTHALRGGQELLAAIGNVQPGETTTANVNAWTTLAAQRTIVVAGANLEADIEENNERLGLHLRRDGPERNPLPIGTTGGVDLSTTSIESTNDRAVLALAHAGLSRAAAELGDAAGLDPGAITLMDLVEDLGRDVQNGIFDGVDEEGAPVFFDPGATLAATPLTIRTDLASAVSSFLVDAPLSDGTTFGRNASGISTELLFGAGNFYEDIAENNDFRLFSTSGQVFDILPPEVSLALEAEPGAPPGSLRVEQDVRIFGQADDIGSGLNRFEVVFPPGLVNTSPLTRELRLSVPPSFGPNMEELDGGCAAAVAADPTLSALDPASQFCVCTEAADGTENITASVFCFTRPVPQVQFSTPAENEAFNVSDTDIPFAARIIGGWALTSCRLRTAPAVDLTVAPDAQNECVFTTSAARSAFSDGVHQMEVTASDVAANLITADRAFIVETSAPTVAVTFPTPNQALNTASYTLTGTVEDPSIARVELTLTRTFGAPATTEAVFVGTQNATLSGSGATRSWSKIITDTAGTSKSGRRDLTVRAFDTQGNGSAPLAISFVVDNVAPGLPTLTPANFAFEGGSSPVERNGAFVCFLGQFCIDNRRPVPATGRFAGVVLFPNAGAVNRTIERWSTRVDDAPSAPQLAATGADAGGAGIKEIRFAIRTSCATDPGQLNQVLVTSAAATVRLTNSAGFDLKNTHQSDTAPPLCLSVAAVDRANNTSPIGNVSFRWRTIAPPLNLAPITSTGLSDSLDAATFSANAGFTNWLRGTTGNYRALHVYFHNPHAEAVTVAPADPIEFALTLGTTKDRDFSATRLTIWAGDVSKTLRNAQATDAETNTSTNILPRWSLASTGSGSGPRVWSLSNTCGATTCNATAVTDAAPSCGAGATCDEDDAGFDNVVTTASTAPREIATVAPSVFCHFINAGGLPIATSPCTSDGAPFFVVPPGQTVLFSWIVSHTRGSREFVAPGWTSTQVNATVPFFHDDDPGSGTRTPLQTQTFTPPNRSVLWLRDRSGAPLPRNLLWTERNNFVRCGASDAASTVECHSGREHTRIDRVSIEASVSSFKMRTRHGSSPTNRADTVFQGAGTTTAVPSSASRVLIP
ncbi:MAG: hypothetical protein Q8O67_11115 [Deltaproteobacteria bacterium]|nr:hypothetical protein [Deltaproteobacteria bacterium]